MANSVMTKMSSRGRIVIPQEIRRRLKLQAGTRFVVTGEEDRVNLKVFVPPSRKEFSALHAEARREAKRSGIKPSDVTIAIAEARERK